METLLSGVISKLGDQGIDKIAGSVGIDADTAKKILTQAGPLLTSKMAKNAESEKGLESISTALQDHDGSIFGNIDDVVNPNVDTKGSKILEHILGDKVGTLASTLGAQNEIDSGAVGKLLEMAAPLILGQLGAQKKTAGLDAGGIFDILQGEKKQAESSGDSMFMNLAKNFLDANKDGSIVDDLIGIAGKFLKK